MESCFEALSDSQINPQETLLVLYMYRGSFKRERISYAGYAVVTDSDVLESGPTPEKSTDQLVDPIDLTAVLVPVPRGKSRHLHKDSKYAFPIFHAHMVWEENPSNCSWDPTKPS